MCSLLQDTFKIKYKYIFVTFCIIISQEMFPLTASTCYPTKESSLRCEKNYVCYDATK